MSNFNQEVQSMLDRLLKPSCRFKRRMQIYKRATSKIGLLPVKPYKRIGGK